MSKRHPMGTDRQKLVLIVDDQEDDQGVLAWMLGRVGVKNPIRFLADGQQAVRYLKGEGRYANRTHFPFPAVMFLDLQMPVMNGWQVLDWIRLVGAKKTMRIFVYSQPRNISEVQELYTVGADSFIRKPLVEDEVSGLIWHFPEAWEVEERAALVR